MATESGRRQTIRAPEPRVSSGFRVQRQGITALFNIFKCCSAESASVEVDSTATAAVFVNIESDAAAMKQGVLEAKIAHVNFCSGVRAPR
jgi:hypothetical protein